MELELWKSSKMLSHLDMVMETWKLKDKTKCFFKKFRLVYMETPEGKHWCLIEHQSYTTTYTHKRLQLDPGTGDYKEVK